MTRLARALWALGGATVVVCGALPSTASTASTPSTPATAAAGTGAVGTPGAGRVHLHFMLERRLASRAGALTVSQCERQFSTPCYGPAQLYAAYDEQPLFDDGITGAGQTIVVVDSFGSPTMGRDLATFDRQFGLGAPASFRVIQPAGRVPRYDPSTPTMVGWAGETTLDVEWAHAMAPGAGILLVETPVPEREGTSGFAQVVQAENDVVTRHLGDVVSQSFGASEQSFATASSLFALRSAYVNAARDGITVLAATGDTGPTGYLGLDGTTLSTSPVVTWPASDPLVTGVGSTQVVLDGAGNRSRPDQAWNDTYSTELAGAPGQVPGPLPAASGGGISALFRRPAYQDPVAGVVGKGRGVPDVSMSGACSDPVETYDSFGGSTPGWYLTCGTSEATPLFAGIVALADQLAGHPLGLLNPALYELEAAGAPGIVDVTHGTTTVSFQRTGVVRTVAGYQAVVGYDLASGVGSVDAALFVPELVQAAGAGGAG